MSSIRAEGCAVVSQDDQTLEAIESGASPIPYPEISSAGAYVMHGSGILVRVPREALTEGRTPSVCLHADDGAIVSKISGDPWIELNRARASAANSDLPVRF